MNPQVGHGPAPPGAGPAPGRRHRYFGPELGDAYVADTATEGNLEYSPPITPPSTDWPAEADAAVRAAVPDADVRVLVVWDPPWTPERLSPVALERLGFDRRT